MSKYHPLPWRVEYFQRFIEWDARSCPRVVDAAGNIVVTPPQHVIHRGDYDEQADATCHEIVAAANQKIVEREREIENLRHVLELKAELTAKARESVIDGIQPSNEN